MREIVRLDLLFDGRRDISLSPALGINKNAYQVGLDGRNTLVTFYPPNTFPNLSETGIEKPTHIFGRKPPMVPDEGWNSFRGMVRSLRPSVTLIQELPTRSDIHRGGRVRLAIEAHPISLLNAAVTLDLGNYSVTRLRNTFAQTIKGPVYGEFIDLILAGKFIDSGDQVKATPDFEGEALMLCALLGDNASVEELIKRRLVILEKDKANSTNKVVDLSAATDNGLAMKDLLGVHATEHLPVVDESGNLYIRSIFDGSGELGSRLTVHFALNHYVGSHKSGDWHYRPYVIMAPLTELVNLNGFPLSLRPEDTYFCTSPGEGLKLPESTVVILPEEVSRDLQTKSAKARVISYRNNRFTRQEIRDIATQWNDVFWTAFDSRDRSLDIEARSFLDNEYEPPAKFQSLDEFVTAALEVGLCNYGIHYYCPGVQVWKELGTWIINGARGQLDRLLRGDSDLEDFMKGKQKYFSTERKWVLPYVLRMIGKVVEAEFGQINKKLAVQKAIESLGFRVENIEPHYLGYEDWREDLYPEMAKEVLELARKIGIPVGRHIKTIEKDVEELIDPGAFGNGIRNRLYLRYAPPEVDEFSSDHPSSDELKASVMKEQQSLRDNFWVCTPQLRRVVYLMGGYQIGDFWGQ